MEFYQAVIDDLPAALLLYKFATEHMIEQGIEQWDAIYPTREVLKDDIERGTMYVYKQGGELVAAFVVNQEYEMEYEQVNWNYPDTSFAVIHRLCVHPAFENRGIGAVAMQQAEAIIKDMGIKTVRLDTCIDNPSAVRLYEKLNYTNMGTVTFRHVCYCYEKLL